MNADAWNVADPTACPTCGRDSCEGHHAEALAQVHETFRRWLGADYDLDAIDAVLAAVAAERLAGDPLWLLIVSGSGNAKTETVMATVGAGAVVVSTISSEGALLSASPKREKAKDATGGLLRVLGPRGVLVIKDLTSVISMHRDLRAAVLAALREIYDGRWSRLVGTDGGRTELWEGRLAVIGAVTTAWDTAHDVIASMGDRFVLLRMDSTVGRVAAGWQAITNTGHEKQMREELAAAVAEAIARMNPITDVLVTEDAQRRLLAAADVVTRARTGVEYDRQGNVIDSHAPEMPTRFAKQLAQVVRGGLALGMRNDDALRLAIRCARDSMPPLRLAILDDVAAHPYTRTSDVRRRLQKPRTTVDRQLQALHQLGLLVCDEAPVTKVGSPDSKVEWRYSLAPGIDPTVLEASPDLSGGGKAPQDASLNPTHITDISGEAAPEADHAA